MPRHIRVAGYGELVRLIYCHTYQKIQIANGNTRIQQGIPRTARQVQSELRPATDLNGRSPRAQSATLSVSIEPYSGGTVITVDYRALTSLQDRMAGLYHDIYDNLNALSAQVESLLTTWEGAAAEGFEQTVRAWQNSAADLHQRLAELHNMVGAAHDNQARTVRSNSRIWAGRRT